ncbi:MAG: hypothetical protein EA384_00865 [Spirochaetaceae bacterium]|nr:MAG: hypothetical protein EA384_00865 [Spirochaetaceae bacterium]
MIGPYCSIHGRLVPLSEATVPIDDVNFQYGYGVYETIKVRKGVLYFPEMHQERLFHSAAIIGLGHVLQPGDPERWTRELIAANQLTDANIKQLLIGSPTEERPELSRLYIMALNPLFPDRKLYRRGASLITFEAERQYPQAKSLNMLASTIAFRKARAEGAYDALLASRDGCVTEGTRTNFYVTDGHSIRTAPEKLVLAGVTRTTVNQVIRDLGVPLIEETITHAELERVAGCFVTSTSSKVMPVGRIDNQQYEVPQLVRRLMQAYDDFLRRYAVSE